MRDRGIALHLAAFAVLQLADAATTLLGLHTGASEFNPLARAFFALGGGALGGLALMKLAFFALALSAARQPHATRLVGLANLWFVGVVGWNVIVLAKVIA